MAVEDPASLTKGKIVSLYLSDYNGTCDRFVHMRIIA